jgi:hypothetical protein
LIGIYKYKLIPKQTIMMYTMNIFNNKYAPKNENPHQLVKNNPNINKTRTNCNATPFRMPYNHVRKTSNCDNCIPNVKVQKDPIALAAGDGSCFCYDPTIRNYLNKNGIPQHDFIFDHYNVMYKRAMVYEKNTPNNMYGTTDVSNVFLSTNPDPSNNKIELCSKLVYKFSNHTNRRYGASSQKARINRLRYNNTTAMQSRFYSFDCKDSFKCLHDSLAPARTTANALNCVDRRNGSKNSCN